MEAVVNWREVLHLLAQVASSVKWGCCKRTYSTISKVPVNTITVISLLHHLKYVPQAASGVHTLILLNTTGLETASPE